MQCNNEEILIEQKDFECIGEVARHCDLSKLCIAIGEAKEFDMSELFCDFWTTILDIWDEIDLYQTALSEYNDCVDAGGVDCIVPVEPIDYDLKLNLICGGSFQSCNGKLRNHLGIKRIWVYYSYAKYVQVNQFDDTPNGLVNKTNDFTVQVQQPALNQVSDRYRSMGYESFKKTLNFICNNKVTFDFEGECGGCGCGDDHCGRKTKAKGYGWKGSIISKTTRRWDV